MKNRIILYVTSLIMMCSMFILPVSAYYGTVSGWDGLVTFEDTQTIVFLSGNVSNSTSTGNISGARVTYEGVESNVLHIEGLTPGTVLNGELVIYGNASLDPSKLKEGNYFQGMQLNFQSDSEDNITFSGYCRDASVLYSYDFAVKVTFNSYYCTLDYLDIPFSVEVQTGVGFYSISSGSLDVNNGFYCTFNYSSDWAGYLDVYTDLRDVPSLEGYFASQNQEIVDSINQHDSNERSWFNQLITSMGLGFQKLYDQMTEENDEVLNGYEGGAAVDANNAFSSGAGELSQTEEQLTSKSSQYVDDFTVTGFDAGVLDSLGSSLVFVVTWFTNFWNMGGLFTAALTLCFAVSIAFFILKLKR